MATAACRTGQCSRHTPWVEASHGTALAEKSMELKEVVVFVPDLKRHMFERTCCDRVRSFLESNLPWTLDPESFALLCLLDYGVKVWSTRSRRVFRPRLRTLCLAPAASGGAMEQSVLYQAGAISRSA